MKLKYIFLICLISLLIVFGILTMINYQKAEEKIAEEARIKAEKDNILSTATKLTAECTEARAVVDAQMKVLSKDPTSENLKILLPIIQNTRTICNRGLLYFREHQAVLDNGSYWATDAILWYETNREGYDKMIDVASRGANP